MLFRWSKKARAYVSKKVKADSHRQYSEYEVGQNVGHPAIFTTGIEKNAILDDIYAKESATPYIRTGLRIWGSCNMESLKNICKNSERTDWAILTKDGKYVCGQSIDNFEVAVKEYSEGAYQYGILYQLKSKALVQVYGRALKGYIDIDLATGFSANIEDATYDMEELEVRNSSAEMQSNSCEVSLKDLDRDTLERMPHRKRKITIPVSGYNKKRKIYHYFDDIFNIV